MTTELFKFRLHRIGQGVQLRRPVFFSILLRILLIQAFFETQNGKSHGQQGKNE